MPRRIVTRPYNQRTSLLLEQTGIHPVLARLYAARGVRQQVELSNALVSLLAPESLKNADAAARLLASLLERNARLLIVADYDCDGATACAVGLKGLRALIATTGSTASVDFLVPNRFKFGYGLTPEIVALAATHAAGKPDLIITVDNGIASIEGVDAANAAGIAVLVTDHHLPAERLPAAACIVNPNQPGCDFASKNLAGVGVMFYVLLALRGELRKRNAFTSAAPNLGALLDLVALGTVADVVKLDQNNRILVAQGLKRLRQGKASAGIAALFTVAARDILRAGSFDLGFAAGPRLNAAGRLDDMSLGIHCLIAEDFHAALPLAQKLDALNRERRSIESDMQEGALSALDAVDVTNRFTVSLFNPEWHQGVVGIVASRLKDKFHRPAFVFAPGEGDEIKGSGRSIGALHLRDCLDLVSKAHPALIRRFGGHAAAAGLTIARSDFALFEQAFEDAARTTLLPTDLTAELATDGPIESAYFNLQFVRTLEAEVWGQGFAGPVFADEFEVTSQRLVKDKHLKLALLKDGRKFDAIQFNATDAVPPRARIAFRLGVDEFNGMSKVGLYVEGWEPAQGRPV